MAISAGVASLVAGLAAAAATVTTSIISTKQADKANQRSLDYQKQIAAQEQADQEAEDKLTAESQQRARAYGASLLNSDTTLNNALISNAYSDEEQNTSLLTTKLGSSGVESMFA